MASGADDLAEFLWDETEPPPSRPAMRCKICGKWFDSFQKLTVHQVLHQRRRCKHCHNPFSANSITHHEKFCPEKFAKELGTDCEGWEGLPNLFSASSDWIDEMCQFLQKAKYTPTAESPAQVLVVSSNQSPVWVRLSSLGVYLFNNMSDRPVCVIPSETILKASSGGA